MLNLETFVSQLKTKRIHHGDSSKGILVTGSAGFIGREVVNRLSAAGRQLVSMYHHRLPESSTGLFPFASDLSSPDLLAAPLRGIDTVIHLAWNHGHPNEGASNTNLSKENRSKSVQNRYGNIFLLKNLITAIEKAGNKRIIFVSCLGASRKTPNQFLLEKYLCELLIINSEIPQKIIIRSASVLSAPGSNDRTIQSLLQTMKCPGVYALPDSSASVSPIVLKDLVDIICSSVDSEAISEVPTILEIEGRESFKIGELFRMINSKYSSTSKIPIRGTLGKSLLKLIENNTLPAESGLRASELISLWSSQSEMVNDLNKPFPNANFQSIRDLLK